MAVIYLKPKSECKYDILSLGEIMIRLDPGDERHDNFSMLDPTNFKEMIKQVTEEFPNFKVVATTLRNARAASVNDWGAVIYAVGRFHDATLRPDLEIYDRVGGGGARVDR